MMHYHKDTHPDVKYALETAMHTRRRIRVFYGDTETGRDWMEEYDTMGRVGKSTGQPIPLLVHNARSMGGGGPLTHCILKIMYTRPKWILYQHPSYEPPRLTVSEPPGQIGKVNLREEGYVAGVYRDGENVANFKDQAKAARWVQFMRGERMNWG